MRSVFEHRTLSLHSRKDKSYVFYCTARCHIVRISTICFITNNYQLQPGRPGEPAF